MTVSEEEIQKYQQMINTLAPQMQTLTAMWEPLKNILQEFFGKIGVEVKVNKIIYMRNRGKLVYGIVFEGPTHILDQIVVQMGGKIDVGEEKEEGS